MDEGPEYRLLDDVVNLVGVHTALDKLPNAFPMGSQ